MNYNIEVAREQAVNGILQFFYEYGVCLLFLKLLHSENIFRFFYDNDKITNR
jgi:hypothetical protein